MDVPIEIMQEIHNITETLIEVKEEQVTPDRDGRDLVGLCPVFLIVLMIVLRVSWTLYKSFGEVVIAIISVPVLAILIFTCCTICRDFGIIVTGQKTRNPPQRRMYAGSRQRTSLTAQEPTIYVSPSNLPPPPKYECMAPPSYEEVVGIHYPNYQIQPITQPINVALAQGSSNNTTTTPTTTSTTDNVVLTTVNENEPAPAPPATAEQRPASVTVMR